MQPDTEATEDTEKIEGLPVMEEKAGYSLTQMSVLLLVVVVFCALYFKYRKTGSALNEKSIA